MAGMIARRRSLWWVLVCAIAFALVGMHHIAQEPAPVAAVSVSSGNEAPQPHGEHDVLHLCLVVLAVLFVLAWLLERRIPVADWLRSATRRDGARRAPPGGPVLVSLGVLRL